MSFQKMYGLRGPSGLNMVNQAFIIVIAYRSKKEKKEKEKKEKNTRDRSVPDGSDKHGTQALGIQLFVEFLKGGETHAHVTT